MSARDVVSSEPIRNIMIKKVTSIAPTEPVLKAAKLMYDGKIGSIVVKKGSRLAGIVTERDILRCVAEESSPADVMVASIMTKDVVTCGPDTTVLEVLELMNENHVRHLPIVHKGKVIGIVSARDLGRRIAQTQKIFLPEAFGEVLGEI